MCQEDSIPVSAPETPAAPAPEVTDIYRVKYKIVHTGVSGAHSLQRVTPPLQRRNSALIPLPDYQSTRRSQLSDVFDVTREDSTVVEEILLPISEVASAQEAEMRGVIVSRDLSACVRADQWQPDLFSSSAVFDALGRIADGLTHCARLGIHPSYIHRGLIYVDQDTGRMFLVLPDADEITDAMRQDPCLRPVLAADLLSGGSEPGEGHAVYAFALALLGLLTNQNPTPDEPVDAPAWLVLLPAILPLEEEFKLLFVRSLGDGDDRPSMAEWRDLLARCAQEMAQRLQSDEGEAQEDEDDAHSDEDDPLMGDIIFKDASAQEASEAQEVPEAQEAPEASLADALLSAGVAGFDGLPCILPGKGDTLRPALLPAAAIYTDSPKEDMDARLSKLSPMTREKFKVLRFPLQFIEQSQNWYALYDGQLACAAPLFGAQDVDPAAFLTMAADLCDDLFLAAKIGLPIRALPPTAFYRAPGDKPAYFALVQGRNLLPADAKALLATLSILHQVLLSCADRTWFPACLRSDLREKSNLDPLRWSAMLRFLVGRIEPCPHCGKAVLPEALCSGCAQASVVFFRARRDQGVKKEIIAIPANGEPVALSALYPGGGGDPELCIAFDEGAQLFKVTNMSARTWKTLYRSVPGTVAPGESALLRPGLCLALLHRRLEITYDWPVGP